MIGDDCFQEMGIERFLSHKEDPSDHLQRQENKREKNNAFNFYRKGGESERLEKKTKAEPNGAPTF